MSNITSTWTIIPTLQSVSSSINLYGSFLILCPGIVLNIFTMVVYSRKRFWRNTKMGFYYTLDAFFSILACFAGLIAFAPDAFGNSLYLLSTTACQLNWLFRTHAVQFACYFSMFIFFDRTMNIVFRRPLRFFSKNRNIVLVIVVFWCLLFAPNVVQLERYVRVTAVVAQNKTTLVRTCTGSLQTLMAIGVVVLPSRLVPSVFNTTMNILIIRTLIKSKSRVRNVSSSHQTTSNSMSMKELNFAYTLIAQNVLFVVFNFVNMVMNAIYIYNFFTNAPTNFQTTINLLQGISAWGSFIYFSLSFFVSLMFNKVFRQELAKIFSLKNQIESNRVSSRFMLNSINRVGENTTL